MDIPYYLDRDTAVASRSELMIKSAGGEKWVLVKLDKETYGIPSGVVTEMILVPGVTPVPRAPEHIRGVINLRGTIMPLVDLKVRLGLKSALQEMEELIQNLHGREKDHLNWLENLENSVKERHEFIGQLDPHKCAFGVWYDSFTTDNAFLNRVLYQFDEPHKAIHKIGEKVKALEASDEYETALELINKTRNRELSLLIRLFEETRATLLEYMREVAVVMEHKGAKLAITVDHAMSVEELDTELFEELSVTQYCKGDNSLLVTSTARQADSNSVIMLLDAEHLFEEMSDDVKVGTKPQ